MEIAKLSPCPRAQFGAIIIDPVTTSVLSDGYNGTLRGDTGPLCGGRVCLRDSLEIASGTRIEVGCVHAEMNAICNAAALGTPIRGAWIIVNGEPCAMCAKLIRQCGIARVVCIGGGYSSGDGLRHLGSIPVTILTTEQLEEGYIEEHGNKRVQELFYSPRVSNLPYMV